MLFLSSPHSLSLSRSINGSGFSFGLFRAMQESFPINPLPFPTQADLRHTHTNTPYSGHTPYKGFALCYGLLWSFLARWSSGLLLGQLQETVCFSEIRGCTSRRLIRFQSLLGGWYPSLGFGLGVGALLKGWF